MAIVQMTNPNTGRTALFDEPNTSGDPMDFNAPRNAPLANPVAHLQRVLFCSDFDYYQVAVGPTGVTITHDAIPTQNTQMTLGPYTYTLQGVRQERTYALITHNLGYVPAYIILWGGRLLVPSTIIYRDANGVARIVTPFATTTQVLLREVGLTSAVAIGQQNFTYTVVVFKQPVASNSWLIDFDPVTGRVQMGLGKFDSALRMLRRAGRPGDSPFDIALGPCVDIKQGRIRVVLPDGTVIDELGYDGTFAGSPTFQGVIA